MPRTASAVRCDSILRRSKSSAMTKPIASCAAAIAHRTLSRNRFELLKFLDMPVSPKGQPMGSRSLAGSLFGLLTFGALLLSAASKPHAGAAISGQAKSPINLGGQMPSSFAEDMVRVVSEGHPA